MCYLGRHSRTNDFANDGGGGGGHNGGKGGGGAPPNTQSPKAPKMGCKTKILSKKRGGLWWRFGETFPDKEFLEEGGGGGGGHNEGMGEWCGRPRCQSPSGDKMGCKINILSTKTCAQQILKLC